MVICTYDYNNPYHSKKQKTEYARYYHAFTKKLLCHEDCIMYATSQAFRYKSTEYKQNRKQRQEKENVNLNKVVYNFDNDYDKEGIINTDKYYIYYKDKVYSKERFKYLSVMKNNKEGRYVLLNAGTYHNYKYILTGGVK